MERQHYLEEQPPELPFSLEGDEPDYFPDDELEELVRGIVYTLRFVGGTVVIGADRVNIGGNLWLPRGYAVNWDSYAPGERPKQQPQQKEKPEPRNRAERRQQEKGRNGQQRARQRVEQVRQQAQDPDPEDEDLEPEGGTVVDEAPQRELSDDDVDPDNAGVQPDVQADPQSVFAGDA